MAEVNGYQSVGRPGNGAWSVNGRELDEYFPMLRHRNEVTKALEVTNTEGSFDVSARIRGGGPTGQAEALRLAVARAILASDEEQRSTLRAHDLLTRDPRVVERKKPGRPKARKRFQFSKR